MLLGLLLAAILRASDAADSAGYLVMLERAADPAYRAAAERLAALHQGTVALFDAASVQAALPIWRRGAPAHVVFVMRPADIDVEFAHRVLETATLVDDDRFVDFAYGFVTGRDGPAAARFVERIREARAREFGTRGAWFGTWEGLVAPPLAQPMSATRALGFEFSQHYVLTRAEPAQQRAAARAALADLGGRDLLLFFSHGYPDQMVGCYDAADLRDWNVSLAPAVLINCACFNGAPGRWWSPTARGFEDMGVIDASRSVALEVLERGVSAFIGGIDPWHGPLAFQLAGNLLDDGVSLGAACKSMLDRLALEFAPEPIAYKPVAQRTTLVEGTENRRSNAAGMILYGDPAFAPLARRAARLFSATVELSGARPRIVITCKPLIAGFPGADFPLATSRLLDYFSIRSGDVLKQARFEVYRAVDWPESLPNEPALRVVEAVCGEVALPCEPVQALLEATAGGGRRMHVRVPLTPAYFGTPWQMALAQRGFRIVLEVEK